MFESKRALAVSFLAIAIILPSLVQAQPAPPPQTAFQKEWAEVVKKYPHVAHSYLMAMQALNEGVRFALVTDSKAFSHSAFRNLVRDLCLERQGDRYVFIPCDQIVDKPVQLTKCRRCGACALPETVMACSDCMQANADAGCLP